MTINDISDNRKENIKQYLNDIGLCVVNENDKFVRIKDKGTSTYINIYWKDIFSISKSLYIDLDLSYTYLKSNCFIHDLFSELSENYLINSSNKNIKIWSQRVNGSNDLWLYGFLKDNVGEFSIELDLKEIGTLWLTEEEVNNPRLLLQAFNKHDNNMYDLYTRLYIDNVEIEIADASQFYKLIFLRVTRHKIIDEFDGNLSLILKNVNFSNVHDYIQQAIFLFNLLNDHKMTFGFSTPNKYKLTGYDNINFLEFKTSKAKYLKAIFLFNNAETQSEETSFLHYYRILEHFYYINYNEVICEENLLKKLFSNPQLKSLALHKQKMQLSSLIFWVFMGLQKCFIITFMVYTYIEYFPNEVRIVGPIW